MDTEIIFVFAFLTVFLVLVLCSWLLHERFNLPTESSRKFLHVSGGILALMAPLFFDSHWPVLFLCLAAFVLLLITYLKHWLVAVHKVKRKSIGSVIFPIPVYICFFAATQKNNDLLFYLPISFLTISDAVAETAGKKWGGNSLRLMRRQKTLTGSIGFAVCSALIAMIWGIIFELPVQQILVMSLITTVVGTITEMLSTKGWDNITVPVVVLVSMWFL